MKKKTRLILLTIIGALILLLVALGLSYAYMHNSVGEGSHSKLGANSCAKILLMEKSNSISLTNSFPMSENAALNTDSYSFGVRSTCSGNRGFKLYIVTIAGNTISANNIRFALTPKGEKEILTSGIVGQLSSGSSDYNSTQTTQLGNSVGTVDSIYYAYEDNIELGQTTYYDLYMWVDGDATTSVANKSFTAAVAILEGQYFDTDIAIRLAGNINTYDADVTCSNSNDAKWNPLTRRVEVFDVSGVPANCTVTAKTNTNLGNLKSIVEAANDVYLEDNIPTGYTKISRTGYSGSNPTDQFYTTSWSSSTTSGDSDSDATLTFDSTNNMWVTGSLTVSRYYYYFFNVTSAGTYQFCWSQNSGNNNYLYLYKGTTNLINDTYVNVTNSSELCVGVGDLTTTDVIKVVQYTTSTATNVSSMNFGFKKSSTTTNAGYRYEGQAPSNYVWFNNELWRIIGSVPTKIDSGGSTTTTNLIKIVRDVPIGGFVWNKTSPRPDWNQTTLYTLLNNYYYGAEDATNSTYCYGSGTTKIPNCDYSYIGIKPDGYYGTMIKEVFWNTGASQSNIKPELIYSDEINSQIITGHIGIMNISDYGFASSYNRLSRTTLNVYGYGSITDSNWLHEKGCEWSMTGYAIKSNNALKITINYGSSYYNSLISTGYSVRPVIYLDSSVYVVSGNGTEGSPYKIGI